MILHIFPLRRVSVMELYAGEILIEYTLLHSTAQLAQTSIQSLRSASQNPFIAKSIFILFILKYNVKLFAAATTFGFSF